MVWALISLLVILGLGVPILQSVYSPLLNTTNGSWLAWTTSNASPSMNATTACVTYALTYSPTEFATFQFIPLLAGLMALGFILTMLGGAVQRRSDEARMRGEK